MIEQHKYIETGILRVDEALNTFSYALADDFRNISLEQIGEGERVKTDPDLEEFIDEILHESGKDPIADRRRTRRLLLEVGQCTDVKLAFVNGDVDVGFAVQDVVDRIYNNDGGIGKLTKLQGDISDGY